VTDPRPPLVDTHCHLTLAEFDLDRAAVLGRAAQAGLEAMLIPAIDLKSSREAVALAEQHASLYAAVGVHPHAAADWSETSRLELRALARSSRVVAIGEIGLDYYRDRTPRPMQRAALEAQLELAAELGLPVILHSREATEAVLQSLRPWALSLCAPLHGRCGVLHAFQGDLQAAQCAAESGLYLGIGGPLTYPSASGLRDVLAQAPAERLLLETDAPYLPPQGHRGQRNEPSYLPLVAAQLASVRGWEPAEAARRTTANAARLFGWTNGTDDRHLL
jgi:TatD DNase family protein